MDRGAWRVQPMRSQESDMTATKPPPPDYYHYYHTRLGNVLPLEKKSQLVICKGQQGCWKSFIIVTLKLFNWPWMLQQWSRKHWVLINMVSRYSSKVRTSFVVPSNSHKLDYNLLAFNFYLLCECKVTLVFQQEISLSN